MSAVDALRYSIQSEERTSFSPFWGGTVPIVLLAVIILKFSDISAPGLHIQVSSWTFGLLCAWFALGKGVFMHAHRVASSHGPAAAAQAFGAWVRSQAPGLALFALTLQLAAAGFDVLLLYRGAMQHEQVRNAVLGFAAMIWLILAPSFLVMAALSAMRADTTFSEALDLTRGVFSAIGVPWVGVALLVIFLPAGALGLLYGPARLVLVALLPSVLTVYVFSLAFFCGLLLFQIAIQARFAAWIAPRLTGRGAMTPDQIDRRMSPLAGSRVEPTDGVSFNEAVVQAARAEVRKQESVGTDRWPLWKVYGAVIIPWALVAATLSLYVGVDSKLLHSVSLLLACGVRLWHKRSR